MTAIPTIKVTNGKATIIINASDAGDWKAKGFAPVDAQTSAPAAPADDTAKPDRKKKEKKDS